MRVIALSPIKHDGVDYLADQVFDINEADGQVLVNSGVAKSAEVGAVPVAPTAPQTQKDEVVDTTKLADQPVQPGQPTAVKVNAA